jgi:hypothetical protein
MQEKKKLIAQSAIDSRSSKDLRQIRIEELMELFADEQDPIEPNCQ